jgi:predicted enzyme involved in methoxymalonyl-ACP biosynthesis
MVLREILANALKTGAARVLGVYKPTERNELVRGHYQSLGFTEIEIKPNGESWWALPAETNIEPAPMRVAC